MEFYDVVTKRRTIREFLDKEVDFERNMFLNMQKKWLINLMLKSI